MPNIFNNVLNMVGFISVGDKHREWLKQLGQGIGSVYEFLNITAIQENTQDGTYMMQGALINNVQR